MNKDLLYELDWEKCFMHIVQTSLHPITFVRNLQRILDGLRLISRKEIENDLVYFRLKPKGFYTCAF